MKKGRRERRRAERGGGVVGLGKGGRKQWKHKKRMWTLHEFLGHLLCHRVPQSSGRLLHWNQTESLKFCQSQALIYWPNVCRIHVYASIRTLKTCWILNWWVSNIIRIVYDRVYRDQFTCVCFIEKSLFIRKCCTAFIQQTPKWFTIILPSWRNQMGMYFWAIQIQCYEISTQTQLIRPPCDLV